VSSLGEELKQLLIKYKYDVGTMFPADALVTYIWQNLISPEFLQTEKERRDGDCD